MAMVPAFGIMINEVAPKVKCNLGLHIAKCWPVKTTVKRKYSDLFLQFSHADSICGQMAPKLSKNIPILSL